MTEANPTLISTTHPLAERSPCDEKAEPDSSKQGRVLAVVRELIIEGRHGYRPGDMLSEKDLFEDLRNAGIEKISRMPIRNALADLEKEGFVEIIPKVGTIIRRLQPGELREIWDNRAALEEFIVYQLASRSHHVDLRDAKRINGAMSEIAADCQSRSGDKGLRESQKRFVDLDIQFHDALARQANYPTLQERLLNLRLRLHQFVSPSLYSDHERMERVVAEHNAIISAISPDIASSVDSSSFGLRGDINQAKVALRNHLRRGAHRWQIHEDIRRDSTRSEYDKDFIFDMPDIYDSANDSTTSVPIEYLLAMRLTMELAAALEVAAHPGTSLLTIVRMNQEMREIAKGCERNPRTFLPETKARFINLDIGFHASIPFLAHMLFAEEGILYVWRRVYEKQRDELSIGRMRDVVDEHDEILLALNNSKGAPDDLDRVSHAVNRHLLNAFGRNLTFGPKSMSSETGKGTAQKQPDVYRKTAAFLKLLGQGFREQG